MRSASRKTRGDIRRRATCCALAAAAWWSLPLSAAQAQSGSPFLLIDRELRAEVVDLVGIEDGWVECLRSGLIDRRPVSDLLVLMKTDAVDASRFAADDRVLELADGQRWVGAPAPESLPDHLDWKIDRVGVLSAPLERVLRARLLAEAPMPKLDANAAEDRLVLANGDVLSGLLVAIDEQVEFEVAGASEVTRLPLAQVASLALVNPPERASGTMIWLADGSVLSITQCRWSPASFQFTTAAESRQCSVEPEMLRGINFAAERVMPLAELRPAISHDSKWLSVVEAPVVVDPGRAVGLSDVQMRGPVVVEYELPPGAGRLVTTAIVPRFAADWADLQLVVLVDGQVEFDEEMDGAGRSRREIDVPLNGASTLTIRIDEGRRGPIQDVILLQRPMLLFD